MNVATSSGQQEQFDSLKVSINSVNEELNDLYLLVSNFGNFVIAPK